MSEETKTDSAGPSKMQTFLAITVCIQMFMVIAFLLFREIPVTGKEVFLILVGALIGAWKDVYGYAFGSSIGSARKDERQAVMQEQIIDKDKLLLQKDIEINAEKDK